MRRVEARAGRLTMAIRAAAAIGFTIATTHDELLTNRCSGGGARR